MLRALLEKRCGISRPEEMGTQYSCTFIVLRDIGISWSPRDTAILEKSWVRLLCRCVKDYHVLLMPNFSSVQEFLESRVEFLPDDTKTDHCWSGDSSVPKLSSTSSRVGPFYYDGLKPTGYVRKLGRWQRIKRFRSLVFVQLFLWTFWTVEEFFPRLCSGRIA